MTPDQASQQQIEAYRRMTGEQRLRIGLQLYETSCELARESIRAQFPDLTEQDVEQRLQERIRIGYELQKQMETSR